MRFQAFYSAQVLPYICILDPRTGEEKVGYNGFNKTSKEFELELLKFLRRTPYPNVEEDDEPHELHPVDFNVSLIFFSKRLFLSQSVILTCFYKLGVIVDLQTIKQIKPK